MQSTKEGFNGNLVIDVLDGDLLLVESGPIGPDALFWSLDDSVQIACLLVKLPAAFKIGIKLVN